mgnify:CR=1 FL=1|tara:strand:+ start:1728 stop:2084 length:357 start_codon:yes stop_codon:yes gene_type:complete
MKKFKDLKFALDERRGGFVAKLNLGRNRTISVISRKEGGSNDFGGQIEDDTYEVAILGNDDVFFALEEQDDVARWFSREDVEDLMTKAQSKGFVKYCNKNKKVREEMWKIDNDEYVPF